MKKKVLLILVLSLTFLLGACSGKDQGEAREYNEKDYEEAVKSFTKLDIKELNSKIDKKESFLLYIGRKNCPYCVKLVPDLKNIMKGLAEETFYLDVEKTNKEMDAFFNKYKLEYVPSLLVFKDGKASEVKLDHDYAKTNGRYNIEEVKKALDEKLAKQAQ